MAEAHPTHLANGGRPLRYAARLRARVRFRAGSAVTGILLGLAILGVFAITAMLVRPAVLQASAQPGNITARSPERQHVIEAIAAVVGSAAEVLAVHHRETIGRRGTTAASVEIVLRTHNADDTQFISPEEIAVISHSRILQVVTFYKVESEREGDVTGTDSMLPQLLHRDEVLDPEFCKRWRGDSAVSSRVIAAGVSDFRADWGDEAGNGRSQLRLALTWADDSADGADEAALLVEVSSKQDEDARAGQQE